MATSESEILYLLDPGEPESQVSLMWSLRRFESEHAGHNVEVIQHVTERPDTADAQTKVEVAQP